MSFRDVLWKGPATHWRYGRCRGFFDICSSVVLRFEIRCQCAEEGLVFHGGDEV